MPASARPPDALAQRLAPYAGRLRAASWAKVCEALLWIAQAALVVAALAGLFDGRITLGRVWALAAGFAGLAALRAGVGAWAELRLEQVADRAIADLRGQVLQQQQAISPYDPAAPSSAVIAALITDKLPVFQPYLTRFAPAMAQVRVLPVVILACIAPLSWAAALVLGLAGPLVPVMMAVVGVSANRRAQRQMEEISDLNSLLMERLSALVDIRLLDASAQVAAQFDTKATGLRQRTMAVLRVAFLSSTLLELLASVAIALVAIHVGLNLLGQSSWGSWGSPLSPARGLFILLLVPAYFQPLRDMSAAWHDRASARAVAQELADLDSAPHHLMRLPASAPADAGSSPLALSWQGVEIGGHALPDGHLTAGEAVALSGRSGRGKSTLIAAIAGTMQLAQGQISVNGVPLDDVALARLRPQIAWLPQQPFFFAGRLRDNLTLGREPARALEDALALASADQVVARLPDGLDTPLGETGAGVSGGEARRLILARAACQNARLVLADEPTADLDDHTAAQVIAGLLALRDAGATVLAATHDPRLIAALDREVAL